jgi:hypothetical protein
VEPKREEEFQSAGGVNDRVPRGKLPIHTVDPSAGSYHQHRTESPASVDMSKVTVRALGKKANSEEPSAVDAAAA